MRRIRLQDWVVPAALLLLAVPVIFYRLGGYSLVNGDEALYHGVAEAMASSGDWLTLRFRGRERLYDTFMNAPLHYWARAFLIERFGSNLWTARILSALAAVGCVLATHGLALRSVASCPRRTRCAAGWAGLVLLTTFQFVYLHSARTGELDTLVSLAFVGAAWAFLRFQDTGRGIWIHHACLAVLLTLKLPLVGVALLTELAIFATVRQTRPRFWRWLGTGAAVAPLALSWHVAQAVAHPEAFLQVVRDMGGQATGGQGGVLDPEQGPLAFYAGVLLFGAYPWSLLFPVAVPSVLRRAAGEPGAWRWRALALFPAVLLLFHLMVSKRAPWYVIPAYPFLSVFAGAWLVGLLERRPGRVEAGALAVAVALGAWLSVGTTRLNPFALPALNLPMAAQPRTFGALGAGLGVPLTAVLLAAGSVVLSSRLGGRAPRILGGALVAVAVSTAGARVVLPLRFTDYQSPVARLRSELDALRASGRTLDRPVDVPRGPLWVVVYTFEPEYEIVRTSRPDRPFSFQVRFPQSPRPPESPGDVFGETPSAGR